MAKKAILPSTQKYLNILAIRDGMVVLRDGGIRAILEVGSLNFALKSEDEQNGMIYQYQQFLNSLKFPIQIVMQSRRLDLYNYMKKLNELLEKQTNDLIRIQTEEYINYIEKLLTRANIMDKKFFLVIPYFPSGVQKAGVIDKMLGGGGGKTGEVHFTKEKLAEHKDKLKERVNVVSGSLGGLGLRVRSLETQEIIEVLYGMYNPTEAISERMTEVSNLESPIVKSDIGVPSSAVSDEVGAAAVVSPEPVVSNEVMSGSEVPAGTASVAEAAPPVLEAVTPVENVMPIVAEDQMPATEESGAVFATPQVIQDVAMVEPVPAVSSEVGVTPEVSSEVGVVSGETTMAESGVTGVENQQPEGAVASGDLDPSLDAQDDGLVTDSANPPTQNV